MITNAIVFAAILQLPTVKLAVVDSVCIWLDLDGRHADGLPESDHGPIAFGSELRPEGHSLSDRVGPAVEEAHAVLIHLILHHEKPSRFHEFLHEGSASQSLTLL